MIETDAKITTKNINLKNDDNVDDTNDINKNNLIKIILTEINNLNNLYKVLIENFKFNEDYKLNEFSLISISNNLVSLDLNI